MPGSSSTTGSGETGPSVIRNARIIDGSGRPPLERHAIFIESGNITGVLPESDSLEFGPRHYDASGKTVIPGLIDMHAHLISGGFDTVVDVGASYEVNDQKRVLRQMLYWGVVGCHFSVQPMDNGLWLREAAASGEIEAPRLYISGPGVTAPAGWAGSNLSDARLELDDPDDAPAAIEKLAGYGVDFVKVFYDSMCCAFHQAMPMLRKDVLERVIAEAHRHGLPVAVHVYELEGHRDVLRAGGDILYHSAVTGSIDEDYLEAMRANGSLYVATLSIYNDTYEPEAIRAWADSPWVRESVPKATLDSLGPGGPLDEFDAFTRRDNIARQLPTIMANMKTIHDAGIPFAAGPDTGVPGVFPGLSVHREMELMVAAGVPELAAISAATSRAATFAGEPALGSLAPGKSADLLILSEDPLADIRATRSIECVIKQGKTIDRERLRSEIFAAECAAEGHPC